MGGNKKQAQRTKNNARPSSSCRSAELLVNNASQSYSFTSNEQKGFIVPIFPLSKTEDMETVSTDFQLIIKKMNKQNSTTKIKALQEFSQLVKDADVEMVKTALPFWPRLFNSLTIDSDHKVRETAHKAHHVLVSKVKTTLKPYLKEMIAPWFISQYDTYPPAASAAASSFSAACPDEIFHKVMLLFTEEILNYIHDNLYVQTPQSIGDPKHNTAEGAEAKYERLVISSLHGYSLYLNKSSPDGIKEAAELNKKIVSNKMFWKYSKHSLGVVRAAWFQVLAAIFEKAQFLLENEEGNVTSSTLGSINENDPLVLPHVWQNVLLTVTNVKEWWTKVNIEKSMLPDLWKLLKEGGRGNAAVIYPNLLPLLSHLEAFQADVGAFYDNFFKNLGIGLKQKSVLSAKVESTAVSTTLIECLRYVVMKYEPNEVMCEKLIKTHLISTLECCVLEKQSCNRNIFNEAASLTQYWRENAGKYKNYSRYLDVFWSSMDSFFQDVLVNVDSYEDEKLLSISQRQIEFFQAMKRVVRVKKTLKVSFDEDGNDRDTYKRQDEFDPSFCYELVLKRCEAYVRIVNEKKSRELLVHLVQLIELFNSEEFILKVSERVGDGRGKIVGIFDEILKDWLECDELCCKPLVNLVFLIFEYLGQREKMEVLKTVEEIVEGEKLGWFVEAAMNVRYNDDLVIQKWRKSERFSEFLVEVVERESFEQYSDLLELALSPNKLGDLRISQDAVLKIIEKLKQPLLNPTEHQTKLEPCSNLAAKISGKIYTKKLLLTYGDDLLISLITLSCSHGIDPDYLSSDTLENVKESWWAALSTLSSNSPANDLEKLLDKIVDLLQKMVEDSDEKSLKGLVDLLVELCGAFHGKLEQFLEKLYGNNFVAERRESVGKICRVAEYLNGEISFCYDEFDLDFSVSADDGSVLKFFRTSFLMARVLLTLPTFFRGSETEHEEETVRVRWLAELMYDFQLAECFCKNFRWVKFSKEIERLNGSLHELFRKVIKGEDRDGTESERNHLKLSGELVQFVKEESRENSWIWCRIAHTFSGELWDGPTSAYEDLVKDATETDKQLVVHATQVFGKHLDFDYVSHNFDDISRMVQLRSLSGCKEIDVQIAEVMGQLEVFRSDDVARFYCESLSTDWKTHQLILESVRLFEKLVENQFNSLSRRYIDLIVISLAEWFPRLLRHNRTKKGQALIISVIALHQKVSDKMNELKTGGTNAALTKEWDDLFAETVQDNLVELWLSFEGGFKSVENLSITTLPYIDCFLSMSAQFDDQFMFKKTEEKTPKWSKLLKKSCSLLRNQLSPLQLAGHRTIMRLVPGLVEIDSLAVNTNAPNENGLVFENFKEISGSLREVIDAMLLGMKVGEDSCRVELFTETYCHTLAYLLVWNVILALCEKASMELKYQYADWLRQEDTVKSLFENIFRLMPIEILHVNRSYQNSSFFKLSMMETNDINDGTLDNLVCYIFSQFLSQLPALVRQWWTSTESRVSQIVDRITSTYLSPQLRQRELANIGEKKFKNMTVKVRTVSNEIVAVYTVDESKMELLIKLPENYPLAGPEVVCDWQIGGNTHKQWLLQFKKCVLHQNGSILDGLSLWYNNLDKKFDGVEECYICFSVLHPGTYQLPKLSCQTCKKKFHSACLYKWFSTSNKSSCPICRNLF